MMTISVNVEEHHGSTVIVESGGMSSAHRYLDSLLAGRNIALITDTTVSSLYRDQVTRCLDIPPKRLLVLTVDDGEKSKSLSAIDGLAARLAQEPFHRSDIIIALGGGVILDMAGFLASIYMRGIRYISIPTTLLSQADACIGGKVAVNHAGGRNLLGHFHHPEMVLVDPRFLKTLHQRDLKSGLAEVVKAGIIGDETLFESCETRLDDLFPVTVHHWDEMIIRALRVKKGIIEKDEKEKGPRMVLNLGHTVGHGLEIATDYKTFRHGESVAVGMLVAAVIAKRRGLLTPESFRRMAAVMIPILPGPSWRTVPNTAILNAMKLDKKKRFDRIPFILPKGIGEVAIFWDVDEIEIREALDEAKKYGPEDI